MMKRNEKTWVVRVETHTHTHSKKCLKPRLVGHPKIKKKNVNEFLP